VVLSHLNVVVPVVISVFLEKVVNIVNDEREIDKVERENERGRIAS
jgi:hypothetical protein